MTKEIFEAAIEFAVSRCATKGDAQARSAEFDRSFIKNEEVVLRNKPISGWRFPEVELTRVSLSDISA